ncbi:MAG: dihydrofolate reductase, partial [Actinomycetaceae bacterium]|nr:dihydrofolate reductase [Actinomycetaceae bacterium]
MNQPLHAIWCQDLDRVIAVDGEIPWRHPEDLAHFRATTLDHPIIMGRATW